ncbi:MAG: PAS domain S-box protein, partial [Methanobacterium sp.]|nr:PAS domain S-box protein [Methanobacterium sp.]
MDEKDKERKAGILESKEELRNSNLYLRELIEVSIDPLVTIGPDGNITDVNKAVELATGYSRDQLIGTDFSDYFTDPDKARAGYMEVFQEGFVKDYPLEIQHKKGRVMPVLYNASVYKDEKGLVIGVFAAARDISQLKKAEAKLKTHMENLEIIIKKRTAELTNANLLLKAEIKERKRMEIIIQDNVRRLNLALEAADMGAWDLDLVSDTAIRTIEHDQIFGYDSLVPEWGSKILFEHILPEDLEYVQQKFEKAYQTNKLYFQCRIIREDNKQVRWIETYGNVYRDDEDVPIRMLGVVSDITERKEAETQLLKVIGEKETLLKEIHHRVNNNMQIISSLLSLESSQLFDKRDIRFLEASQDRIRSMALIHEDLYQSEGFSSIKFKYYVNNLTSELLTTYGAHSHIKIVTDIQDVSFNMETAIPLGLIINELVTNSLKHAFPDLKGEISIFIHNKGEEYELIIKDNGMGLPKEIDLEK